MQSNPPVTFVFFDAAYTLIEPQQSVGVTYSNFAKPFGVFLDAAVIDQRFREAFKKAPALCFPGVANAKRHHLETEWWHALVENVVAKAHFSNTTDFETYFSQLYSFYATKAAWKLCGHTLDLLQTLAEKSIPMAIISNFDSRLRVILEALEIRRFFSELFISSEVGFAKPDLEIFRHALKCMNIANPATAAYLGDDITLDFSPSNAVGMRAMRCNPKTFSTQQFLMHIGFIPEG